MFMLKWHMLRARKKYRILKQDNSGVYNEITAEIMSDGTIFNFIYKSRGSAVGIAICHGLDDDQGAGVRVPVLSTIFTSGNCPDLYWGPLNLLYNGYGEGGRIPQEYSGRSVKPTTHLQLVPRSRKPATINPLPPRMTS
jgi:hypothetical protein